MTAADILHRLNSAMLVIGIETCEAEKIRAACLLFGYRIACALMNFTSFYIIVNGTYKIVI